MTPLYALGFPTPVVELLLAGAALFAVTAGYLGLRFEGIGASERPGDGRRGTADADRPAADRETAGEDATDREEAEVRR